VTWLLFSVFMWGIPLLMVSIAWWRYRQLGSVPRRDLVLLRIAISCLLLNEGILVFIGVVAGIHTLRPNVGPQTLGFVGVLLCAASLLALLMAKKNADTIRAWKVIAAANIYLILLWPFLMLSH
jgi:hypothetical protein